VHSIATINGSQKHDNQPKLMYAASLLAKNPMGQNEEKKLRSEAVRSAIVKEPRVLISMVFVVSSNERSKDEAKALLALTPAGNFHLISILISIQSTTVDFGAHEHLQWFAHTIHLERASLVNSLIKNQ
jgi:hypothetical protein